jgi:signal transduction histidine kinase
MWRWVRTPTGIDAAICAMLLVIGVPPTLSGELGAGTWADTALLPTLVAPVMISRRAPLTAAAVFAPACIVSGVPTFDQFRLVVAIPASLVVLVRVGRQADLGPAITGLGLVLAGIAFVGLTDVALDGAGGGVGAMVTFAFPLCVGVWGLGRMLRKRDLLVERLAEQSRRLERRREETAALAVEVDRTRLAGELRTGIRDRVAEIVALAASDPTSATERFARIERVGRESLNELRGLLGVLRSDDAGSRSPRPTLADLETLLGDARRGGRLVDLEVHGTRPALSSGVELAAYRVLQHALTAIRGSGGEPAKVVLRYLPAEVEVEVRGSPQRGAGAAAAIAAAGERARAQGGRFSARDTDTSRTLTAHLPVAVAHA